MKVRCIDALNTRLTLGSVYTVAFTNAVGHYVLEGLGVGGYFPTRFEPVSDTIPAPPPPEPAKVDPYEAHRERLARIQGIHECDMRVLTTAEQPGATARLHAALAAEKPVERVKTFPKAARNPR